MRIVKLLAMAISGLASLACAQAEEFVPASGRGRAVVVVSGAFGAGVYRPQARRLALLGYDVHLVDGRDLVGQEEAGLKAAIAAARGSVHAVPGKVAFVGFSLGGGRVLERTTAWAGEVGAIVVMYPVTTGIADAQQWAGQIAVPTLLITGEADAFRDCCRIGRARALAAAAQPQHSPFELVSYAGIGHDFIVEGTSTFNRRAARQAWASAATWLRRHL